MERDDYINQILNSVTGIAKVAPSDTVFENIEQLINKSKISTKTLWLVAASIVVLISLNIVLLSNTIKDNDSEMASLEHIINKNNQIYK